MATFYRPTLLSAFKTCDLCFPTGVLGIPFPLSTGVAIDFFDSFDSWPSGILLSSWWVCFNEGHQTSCHAVFKSAFCLLGFKTQARCALLFC